MTEYLPVWFSTYGKVRKRSNTMKKSRSLPVMFMTVFIFLLVSCGTVWNGDRKLTKEKLYENTKDNKLSLEKIYLIDYSNSGVTNNYWIILSDYSEKADFIALRKEGSVFNVLFHQEGSSHRRDVPSAGMQPDAYVIGVKSSKDTGYQYLSQIVYDSEVIHVSANDRATWNVAAEIRYSRTSSSAGSASSFTPSYSQTTPNETYKYAWLLLPDSSYWLCLGDVSDYFGEWL